MMRWSSGMKEESTLSRVVLPVPVPPEIRMFKALNAGVEQRHGVGVRVPKRMRSSTCRGSGRTCGCEGGPSTASGGMIPLTREPSGSGRRPWGRPRRCGGPTLAADAVDDRRRLSSVGSGPGCGAGASRSTVDGLGPIHHDLGDGRVAEEVSMGRTEDVLADLLAMRSRSARVRGAPSSAISASSSSVMRRCSWGLADRGLEGALSQLGEEGFPHPGLVLANPPRPAGPGSLQGFARLLELVLPGGFDPVAELHGLPPRPLPVTRSARRVGRCAGPPATAGWRSSTGCPRSVRGAPAANWGISRSILIRRRRRRRP